MGGNSTRLTAPAGQAANAAKIELIGFSIRYLARRLRTRRWWLHHTTGGGPASGRFLRFRHMGRNGVHQWRRQAIIGLESEFLQTLAYAVHLFRLHAGLDDG